MNLSVSELVRSIKSVLDSQPHLQRVKVVGELSNLTKHRSGHWYFSLKDDKARINCVMFASYNQAVSFVPKEGQQVVVSALTTVYVGSGQLQLVCSTMALDGEGALYQQYLELRDKLQKEGLFSPQFKQFIPNYPQRIGVIAGHQSAALADVLKTLESRWPLATVVVYESLVQGPKASEQLLAQLQLADQAQLDVILLVRGGGSLEDLWAFNNEALARGIFAAKTPIITGVGHEVDVTLVDYVADLRALTPTAAAQLATPDYREVQGQIAQYVRQMNMKLQAKLKSQQAQLQQIQSHRYFQMPDLLVHQERLQLKQMDQQLYRFLRSFDQIQEQLQQSIGFMKQQLLLRLKDEHNSLVSLKNKLKQQIDGAYTTRENHLQLLLSQLDGQSPLKAMTKGFVLSHQENRKITSITQINVNQPLSIEYIDGQVQTQIVSLEKGNTYGKTKL